MAGQERLVLLPDDVLWRLPFEALPTGDSDLATKTSVTYGTSLVTLAMQSGSTARSSGPADPPGRRATFGSIAGPAIAPTLRAQLTISAPAWIPRDATEAIATSRKLAAS